VLTKLDAAVTRGPSDRESLGELPTTCPALTPATPVTPARLEDPRSYDIERPSFLRDRSPARVKQPGLGRASAVQ